MSAFLQQLDRNPVLDRIRAPDPWQQEAVTHLRSGRDVVVQAPTGSGKTLIFELWARPERMQGQALYTVPTRALANDKLAEWRRKGWNAGIATGDISENTGAPLVVGTLEALSGRLGRDPEPKLLVVDEYQLIGDPDRGLHYELTIAQAPPRTRLLLLSGSVANPEQVTRWLCRLGRDAVSVVHHVRPVPIEEVSLPGLRPRAFHDPEGYWPRMMARALIENLGPILVFSPHRSAAESLALELGEALPDPHPLNLTEAQRRLLDPRMQRLLQGRIAYHHSGLSYAVRAGIIEPLAKAGQLRIVVATMGLAAGINFSLRSVAIASDSYRRDYQEYRLAPDALLQMIGRAGRRGIDTRGYFLITANRIGLKDAFPLELERSRYLDWGTLLRTMDRATRENRNPYQAAVNLQERLFTTRPVALGVEQALTHPDAPCGRCTDASRARLVGQRQKEFLNSRSEWERWRPSRKHPVGQVFVPDHPSGTGRTASLAPLLARKEMLQRLLPGEWVPCKEGADASLHARRVHLADRTRNRRLVLSRWTRSRLAWNGRHVSSTQWREIVLPRIEERLKGEGTPALRFYREGTREYTLLDTDGMRVRARRDRHGVHLVGGPIRNGRPAPCRKCPHRPRCLAFSRRPGVADLWQTLGLTDERGHPTLRGRVASFFDHGNGLAVAASLEREDYPLEELVFDLANLDAGHRFSDESERWGGMMAWASRECYGTVNIPGYLENGLPPDYGYGAAPVVSALCRRTGGRRRWITPMLGAGDIDRILIEWRSHLRRIIQSPDLDWPRWNRLREMAATLLDETRSPTREGLPPLSQSQRERMNHRLHPDHFRAGRTRNSLIRGASGLGSSADGLARRR